MTSANDSDLKRFINQQIRPRLASMQSEHRRKSRFFVLSAVLATALVLAGLGWALFGLGIEAGGSWEFGVLVAVVLGFGAALHTGFQWLFVRGVRDRYFETIVTPVIDFMGPEVRYEAGDAIERSEFEASALVQHPVESFETHGVFYCRTEAGEVTVAEIQARIEATFSDRDHGVNRTCYGARGLLFVAPHAGAPPGTTVVVPTLRRYQNADALPRLDTPATASDPPIRPAEGWPLVAWSPKHHGEAMAPVTLPDPDFQAQFDMWSTHVADARGLFRPAQIETIKRITSVWRASAHRSGATEVGGQGYFRIIWRNDNLYLHRPIPQQIIEIRAFPPSKQVELLLELARDIRLSMELIGALRSRD